MGNIFTAFRMSAINILGIPSSENHLSSNTTDTVKLSIKRIPLQRAKLYFAGAGIAALLGVFASLLLNSYLAKETIPVPEIPEGTQDADMHLNKIHYTSTNKEGVKEWELKALAANYFKDKNLAEFEGVDIIFYSEKGRTFSLRGDHGLLNTETKDMQLSGKVIGTSSDGYQFKTEFLTYEADKRQAKTDRKVYLEAPQFNLEGLGMVMDLKKEKMVLLNDVRAQAKQ